MIAVLPRIAVVAVLSAYWHSVLQLQGMRLGIRNGSTEQTASIDRRLKSRTKCNRQIKQQVTGPTEALLNDSREDTFSNHRNKPCLHGDTYNFLQPLPEQTNLWKKAHKKMFYYDRSGKKSSFSGSKKWPVRAEELWGFKRQEENNSQRGNSMDFYSFRSPLLRSNEWKT